MTVTTPSGQLRRSGRASVPSPDEIERTYRFLVQAGDLKDTLRSGFTNAGAPESTAAHSWRLGLWVLALEPYLHDYDLAELYRLALVHDLGEAVTGDVPAIQQTGDQSARKAEEAEAVRGMTASLPGPSASAVQRAAEAYDDGHSREAVLMKGLDKLETLLQHASGTNPKDFDYGFNLAYRREATDSIDLLVQLREYVDALTKARMTSAR